MKLKYVFLFVIISALFIGCGNESSSFGGSADTGNVVAKRVVLSGNFNDYDSIEVAWDSQQNVDYYVLEYGLKDKGLDKNVTLNSDTCEYKLNNLLPQSVYEFKLKIVYKNGDINYSDILEAKTGITNVILKSDTGPLP